MDLCLINARSVRNKTSIIKDFVVENNVDVLVLTETWLRPSVRRFSYSIGDLCLTGYRFIHVPKNHSRGSGVGLLFKERLQIRGHPHEELNSFEYLECSLYHLKSVRIVVISRPPPSQANLLSPSLFCEEFSTFLEHIISSSGDLLMVEDFNIPDLDDSNNLLTKHFLSVLDSFDLKQLVSSSTHVNGHKLVNEVKSNENLITGLLCSSFHIKNIIYCAHSIMFVCHSVMPVCHSILSLCHSIMSVSVIQLLLFVMQLCLFVL